MARLNLILLHLVTGIKNCLSSMKHPLSSSRHYDIKKLNVVRIPAIGKLAFKCVTKSPKSINFQVQSLTRGTSSGEGIEVLPFILSLGLVNSRC